LKPYWESNKYGLRLYNGDCIEVMQNLNNDFDLCLTDPPFGIDYSYDEHDDNMTIDIYKEFLWERIETAEGLVNNGHVFVWQTWLHRMHWDDWFPRDFRVFTVTKGFVQMRRVSVQWSSDPVLFWQVGNVEVRSPSIRDWFHTSSAAWQKDGKVNHPCPRQIAPCSYIINGLHSNNVLDPFVGSGTTMIAAFRCGATCVGIEKSERYCEEASKRLQNEISQGRIFGREQAPSSTLQMEI
jgi:DNA modification methylase